MKIDRFKEINKAGSPLKASFTVVIPEWDLFLRMTYFEKENGQSWFGYPCQEYTNEMGEKKRLWLAYFGERGKPRFEEALKKELSKFMSPKALPEQNWDEQDIPF